MNRALLIAALAAALAGCASTLPIMPEKVLVPITAACPVPELPARPLASSFAPALGAEPADQARAVALYITEINGYADALEALLSGYSTAKAPAK